MSRIRIITLLAGLVLAAALAAACGGDDDGGGGGSAEDKAAVEQVVSEVASYAGADVEAFLERVTDNFLSGFVGMTRDECREDANECVGEPAQSVTFADTTIDGDNASTVAAFTAEDFSGEFKLLLVKADGSWKLDGVSAVSKEVPEGVKKVDLNMIEFAFELNPGEITDGNFAFVVKNSGAQPHEVIVVKIPEDLNLDEAVRSEDEPPGVEDIAFNGPFQPDEEGTVVFDAPLEPGRYALLCFLPDVDNPDNPPHAEQGMYIDFTVP